MVSGAWESKIEQGPNRERTLLVLRHAAVTLDSDGAVQAAVKAFDHEATW